MKRLATACLFLLAGIGVAHASGHLPMSPSLSFSQMLLWEVQHFVTHMSMTYQAIELMFVSPSLGWAMLGDQTLCANTAHFTAHLFDTALHSLMTFVLAITVAAAFAAWCVLKARTLFVIVLARRSLTANG